MSQLICCVDPEPGPFLNYLFLFIAAYKLQKQCENLGVKGYMFFPCQQKSLRSFFWGVLLYESECLKESQWVVLSTFPLAGNFLGASEQERKGLTR